MSRILDKNFIKYTIIDQQQILHKNGNNFWPLA